MNNLLNTYEAKFIVKDKNKTIIENDLLVTAKTIMQAQKLLRGYINKNSAGMAGLEKDMKLGPIVGKSSTPGVKKQTA